MLERLPIATLVAIATKGSKALKVLKTVKVLQTLLSFGPMTLSVFSCSFMLGWAFSAAFVAMLLIHEMGHVAALRRKNIKASMPMFIPFLGAAIFVPQLKRRHDEAYMAYGGPLIGSAAALLVLITAIMLPDRSEFLLLVAFTSLALNLFNLIPISPLDGGRITQAVGPWFIYVGLACLVGLTLMLRTPGMLVIWILIISDLKINAVSRLYAGVVIQAIMMAMILLGIGQDQPISVDIIDIVLASFFNLLSWMGMNQDVQEDQNDDRIDATPFQRFGWFTAWIALIGLLVYLMATIVPMLPPDAL